MHDHPGLLSASTLDHAINALAVVIVEPTRIMQDQKTVSSRRLNGASFCGGGNDERATRVA
jgi:hypothetical protein